MDATEKINLTPNKLNGYAESRLSSARPGRRRAVQVDLFGSFQSVLESSPLLIIAADSQEKIEYVSRNSAAMLGMGVSDAIGRRLSDVFQSGKSRVFQQIRDAVDNQGVWHGEFLINRQAYSPLVLDATAYKIDNEKAASGKPGHFVIIGQDITSRRISERQASIRDKMVTRSEMAGEISHELNNYLSIVLGNLELMGMAIEKGKSDSVGPRMKSMKEGVSRIAKFVEGLMGFTKPGSMPESIDLRSFLESEIFFLKSQPQFENIEFRCDWGGGVPEIEADRNRLQQAFYNLFSNSADALAGIPSAKLITVTNRWQPETETVTVTISDNGCGMPDEGYQKVFRQFYTTKGVGHGFGLLAVKGAIKGHGGGVSAAPGPDGGASFTIELPLKMTTAKSRTASAHT